tara:strand:- start:48 stop:530 length:483 start_codon:yes stop_codon:yes gene_type:complete
MEIQEHPLYPDYYITTCGQVFKKLHPTPNKNGYPQIGVNNEDGKRLSRRIHTLVANTYLPNPERKPQVNHIDGDITNNNLDNLEWATAYENMNAYRKPIQENNNSDHRGIHGSWSNGGKDYYWRYYKTYYGHRYRKSFTNKIDAICYKYIVLLKIKAGVI